MLRPHQSHAPEARDGCRRTRSIARFCRACITRLRIVLFESSFQPHRGHVHLCAACVLLNTTRKAVKQSGSESGADLAAHDLEHVVPAEVLA